MASVNKVILVGNLGRDPETRHLPSGDAVCNFSLATTEKWKDKQGQQQESTTWHQIAFFGRLAEVCAEYLRKGSAVYVEGSIHTRKYTDKQGVERYATEIKGSSMQMLSVKSTRDESNEAPELRQDEQRAPRDKTAQQKLPGGFEAMDSDISF